MISVPEIGRTSDKGIIQHSQGRIQLKLITTKAVAGPLRLGERNVKRLPTCGAVAAAWDRMKLLPFGLVIAVGVLSCPIPIATAQPIPCDNGTGYLDPSGRHCMAKPSGPTNGCDPSSGDLTSCLGGGPWQNQDGSSPDTYWPNAGGTSSLSVAEQKYVNDLVKTYGFKTKTGSVQDIVKVGWAICKGLESMSNDEVISALYEQTDYLSPQELQIIVNVAQNRLC